MGRRAPRGGLRRLRHLALLMFLVCSGTAVLADPAASIAAWEWAYAPAEAAGGPPAGRWQPVELPARFSVPGRQGGFVWLRTVVELDAPAALVVGPLGFSERVYADGVLVGAAGSAGPGFRSPLGGVRGYPLPGEPQDGEPRSVRLLVRLYDPGACWLAAQPGLVPLESLERTILGGNLSALSEWALALYLAVLCASCFYSFGLQRKRYWVSGGLLCLVAALSLAAWGPLSRVLPLLRTLQVHALLLLGSGALLLLFAGEFLALFGRPRVLLLVLSPLLAGIAGLFLSELPAFLTYRFVQLLVVVVTLAAGAVVSGLAVRDRPVQAAAALAACLAGGAALVFPLVNPGVGALRPGSGLALSIAAYMSWVLLSQRFAVERERAAALGELQGQVASEGAVVERLRDGRSSLENRNLESLILANRLVDSAQKQVQSISQIMASIEEGATAETEVMVKERQILSLTGDVDARIADFNQQITGALKELQDLQRTSRTITQAVSQIIGIADKTNMLSLNASIEATKAGEAGRGFGVVAQQVRKLADVTRNVSDQVGGLIRESNRAVEKNVHVTMEMAKGYREIMNQSEKIRQMLEQNFRALEEVAQAHTRIQDGVAGLDQTIRTVLEVSRDLREMTGGLVGAFAWFDELIAGRDRGRIGGGTDAGGEGGDGTGGVGGGAGGEVVVPAAPEERAAREPGPGSLAGPGSLTARDSLAARDRREGEEAGGQGPGGQRPLDQNAWAAELASVVPDESLEDGLAGPALTSGLAMEPRGVEPPEALPERSREPIDELSGPDLDELGAPGGAPLAGGDELRAAQEPQTEGELEELEEAEELEELAELEELEELEEG